MKTIGLIGGMSWESSAVYYELINRKVNRLLGGFHSAKCILHSVDFAEVEKLQHEANWSELDAMMADAARKLELAGAGMVVLCTNTMHLCSGAIEAAVTVPFLHIAAATGEEISKRKIKRVGLLGTKFTMEKDFYKAMLRESYGIEVVIPDDEDRQSVHDVIYRELVHGNIRDESRRLYQSIIKKLVNKGAEGVVLGCTEIPLLISANDVDIPVFDTTTIHAEKAVDWALAD